MSEWPTNINCILSTTLGNVGGCKRSLKPNAILSLAVFAFPRVSWVRQSSFAALTTCTWRERKMAPGFGLYFPSGTWEDTKRPGSLLSSTSPLNLALELASPGSSETARGGPAGALCLQRPRLTVELRVSITFTLLLLLLWLLQAPPTLPPEGQCSKPAGNRTVGRKGKKETYPFSGRSFIDTLVHSFKGSCLPGSVWSNLVCMIEVRRTFLDLWNWVRDGPIPGSLDVPFSSLSGNPGCSSCPGWLLTLWKGGMAEKPRTCPALGQFYKPLHKNRLHKPACARLREEKGKSVFCLWLRPCYLLAWVFQLSFVD